MKGQNNSGSKKMLGPKKVLGAKYLWHNVLVISFILAERCIFRNWQISVNEKSHNDQERPSSVSRRSILALKCVLEPSIGGYVSKKTQIYRLAYTESQYIKVFWNRKKNLLVNFWKKLNWKNNWLVIFVEKLNWK